MKVADLFCGCGGFSYGFEMAGFEIVYGLDNWDIACESFKVNFPDAQVVCQNALTTLIEDIPDSDIIIGGPPCKEFSIAKERRRTFDLSLVNWFLKVVEYKKPKWWIMENVEAVAPFIFAPKKLILKAYEYGVPQLRRRLFAGIFKDPVKRPCMIKFPTVPASEIKGGIWKPGKPWYHVRLGSAFHRRSLLPECLIVQTFPLDYFLAGTLQDRYCQVGNAVPPLLAFTLAEALRCPQLKNFKEANK